MVGCQVCRCWRSGWLQMDADSGSWGHLRIGIHESNFNSWCDEYEDLLQLIEEYTTIQLM